MTGLERRPLGRTDITVPSLCLGTMMYGDQIDEEGAFHQMDRCFEWGIDFFDTAEMYTIPPKKETHGDSERIVGRWLKERGLRDRIFLATKVAGRSTNTWIRPGQKPRVSPDQIRQALDGSLHRLQTDYIDLYQIHWPDRRINLFGEDILGFNTYDNSDTIPIEEQLSTLGALVNEGKIRHLGLSNETPWGVMQFLKAAEKLNLPKIVTVQNAYNLTNRVPEYGLAEIAVEEGVGLLPYSPIGQGTLSGKYLGGQKPAGSRGQMFGRLERYEPPHAAQSIQAYVDLSAELGVPPAALAMQFVTSRPWVTSNIFGASNDDQLDIIFASVDIEWTQEIMDKVNAIHANCLNPCP
ncbi:MAG: aldo/keto reductase [Pseudomonadota bacterium]